MYIKGNAMSVDNLYAELGIDFQPDDREMFVQELADVARGYSLGVTLRGIWQ
jgi:hypothetical protein